MYVAYKEEEIQKLHTIVEEDIQQGQGLNSTDVAMAVKIIFILVLYLLDRPKYRCKRKSLEFELCVTTIVSSNVETYILEEGPRDATYKSTYIENRISQL